MTISAAAANVGLRPGACVPGPRSAPDAEVSVVIPTKNEEGLIAEIIDAVRPHADEILVVDGHSTDRTREIAGGKGARVVLDAGRGKGEALRRSFVRGAPRDSRVHRRRRIARSERHPAAGRADPPGGRGARHRLAHARRQRRAARHRRATAALCRIAAHHAGHQLPLAGQADRQPERISRHPARRRARRSD